MIDGQPELPGTQMILREVSTLRVNVSGIWRYRPDLALRSSVKQGETIGTISNLFGEVLETVTAPHDGALIFLRSFPTIQAGDWAVRFAKTLEPAGKLK